MAQGGVLGNGVRVGFSRTSPVSFTRVPQVIDVEFPSEVPDKVDKTTHGTSKYKKNFPGMIEVGDLVIRCLADFDQVTGTVQEEMYDIQNDQEEVYWRVEIPANRAQSRIRPFELYGYIADIRPGLPIEDKQTVEFVIVHSGEGITRYNAVSAFTLS